MKVFNVNSVIKVKLTEKGISILKQIHEEFYKKYPNIPPSEFKVEMDENGYTTYQLWNFMNIFGPYVGPFPNLPFYTDLLISEENLRDVTIEQGKSL